MVLEIISNSPFSCFKRYNEQAVKSQRATTYAFSDSAIIAQVINDLCQPFCGLVRALSSTASGLFGP